MCDGMQNETMMTDDVHLICCLGIEPVLSAHSNVSDDLLGLIDIYISLSMLLTSFLHLPCLFNLVNGLDGVVGFRLLHCQFQFILCHHPPVSTAHLCLYCISVLVMERSEGVLLAAARVDSGCHKFMMRILDD